MDSSDSKTPERDIIKEMQEWEKEPTYTVKTLKGLKTFYKVHPLGNRKFRRAALKIFRRTHGKS